MFREHTGPDPKPEKTVKPKFRRVKPVSDKRKHELAVYAKLRPVFLEENKVCGRCKVAKSTQVHHKMHRRGKMLNNMAFWLPVCANCHTWITINSLESIEKGYSVYRNR